MGYGSENDGNESDEDFWNDPDIEIKVKKSSASCRIEDIMQISFGGFNARFWAMRKHINTLQDFQIENLPFYSW